MSYALAVTGLSGALITLNILIFIVTSLRPDIGFLALAKPFLVTNFWTIQLQCLSMRAFCNFGQHAYSLFFGTFCLQLIDEKWFWAVLFIGGIFGNILFLIIGPANSSVAGASERYRYWWHNRNDAAYPESIAVFYIPIPLRLVLFSLLRLLSLFQESPGKLTSGDLIVGLIAGFFFRRNGGD